MYYLNSRYYDPVVGRFINVDGIVGANGGIQGYNMFAYCNNNPVMYFDPSGHFLIGTLSGIAIWELGVLIVSVVAALVVTETLIENPPKFPSFSLPKKESKPKVEAIPKAEDIVPPKLKPPVIFPANPAKFNPAGLVMIPRIGTFNGPLISWMDPTTNIEIFRWDANINRHNGPHYHIHGTGHYYPGMLVPEPYASIYFPRG